MQQGIKVHGVIGTQAGDVDTGVQAHRPALIVEGLGRPDLLQQAFGEANHVLGAGDTATAGGKGLEGAITNMMTVAIIDGLEAIDSGSGNSHDAAEYHDSFNASVHPVNTS